MEEFHGSLVTALEEAKLSISLKRSTIEALNCQISRTSYEENQISALQTDISDLNAETLLLAKLIEKYHKGDAGMSCFSCKCTS